MALNYIRTCDDDDVIQKDDFVRVSGAATYDAMFGHVNLSTIDFIFIYGRTNGVFLECKSIFYCTFKIPM